ncbi:hypothetical protein BDW74DRAFT_185585 [Aspergillus multicolor]|uniref:putative C6 finger domain protein n=1 Tax=Aspergillus multicolor TaxID=41759 RepID=UPI003CCE2723
MTTAVECMTSITLTQTAAMDPSADKKRNKLGYHRTSVACVHCRRRKIRCLVAADDPQGRCENCIRLRKECQFFPVDQQPPIEKKSRPNSRIETISNDASTASSSPPTMGEQTDAYYHYQHMPLSAGPEVATFNAAHYQSPIAPFAPGVDAAAPTPIDPSTVPWDEFTTIPPDQQMLANMAAAGKPMVNINMPHHPHVWSQPATPIAAMPPNAQLPGAPTVPSQPQPLSPSSPYAVQPDGSVWQMAPTPTRSMTFPAQQNMPAQYPSPGGFAQPMPPDLKRRVTSPGQGYPIHPQSPPADMQGTPVPVTYAAQPGAMGYAAWQDVSGLPNVNMAPFPIYADVQQAAYGSPPMGPPGSSHGHGHGHQ